jgi:aspartate/methionine/tyrosine aminotransferase
MFPVSRLTENVRKLQTMQSIDVIDKAKILERQGVDVIHTAGNELGGVTAEVIRNAAKKALDDGYTGYGPTVGLPELREAVAHHLKRDGADYDPETEIMITTGGEEGIFLTMQCLINKGDEVLVLSPAFPFGLHIRYSGGKDTYAPLEPPEYMIVAEEVEKYVTSRTRLITLVNPDNPSGRVYTRKELEAISQIAKQHDLFVLNDTVNEALVFDDRTNYNIAAFPDMKDRTIIEGSFSKSYAMAGWRVGYMAAHSTLIENAAKVHAIMNNAGGCTFAQKAAVDVYAGPQDWVKQIRSDAQKGRDYVVGRLNQMPRISCLKPDGGAVAFPKISAYGMTSVAFAEWLLDNAHVSVAPGITYRADENVRINFTIPRIREAMDRIESALRKLR